MKLAEGLMTMVELMEMIDNKVDGIRDQMLVPIGTVKPKDPSMN